MLTDRQKYILSSIIELYEEYGEPIGSKTFLSLSNLDYSSATIRNEMKVLEDEGLIEKTHTSSGRVPTNEGYKYYVKLLVDNDVTKKTSKEREARKKNLYRVFGQSFQQIDDVVNVAASILSQLTSYTAIVLGPEADNSKLVGFRFIPINSKYATGIIVTDNGNVDTLAFELPADVRPKDIEKMIMIIENELIGLPVIQAYQKIQVIIPELMQRYASSAVTLIEDITEVLEKTLSHPIKVSGRINLLDAVDDMDIDNIKILYSAMENHANIAKLLSNNSHKGLNIQIGSDLNDELLEDFTLISTNYDVSDHGEGLIAILGPRKMPYHMTIQLLEDVADILPVIFNQFYIDDE